MAQTDTVRLALPSKGRMESETLDFLNEAGLHISKSNPRQYSASIPLIPALEVLFQRAPDIPRSVAAGDMDLGITGYDALLEALDGDLSNIVVIHDALGFGGCQLVVAVPEEWRDIHTLADLRSRASTGALRVATKHVNSVRRFFAENGLDSIRIVSADGALEAAPAIGYADFIADLMSSGGTLRDNRLKPLLPDGVIVDSQALLIGNRAALLEGNGALSVTRQLLEYIEAHLRARGQFLVFANMRGDSPGEIAKRIFSQTELGGLQGPTISPIINAQGDPGWFAINIVVSDQKLYSAIQQIRGIGGSGVIATPAVYIFEERPARYQRLLAELNLPENA